MNHFPDFLFYKNLSPTAIKDLLAETKESVEKLFEGLSKEKTENKFKTILLPLFDIEERLGYSWGIISHLKNVLGDKFIQDYYADNLAEVNQFFTGLKQDDRIYQVGLSIKEEEWSELNEVERKIVDDLIVDYELNGVSLSPKDKEKFKKLVEEQVSASFQFSKNVVDDTDDFEWFFSDKQDLQGLPEAVLERANQLALSKGRIKDGEAGYLFNLKPNSYLDFMRYQPKRDLREKFFRQYITRASSVCSEKNHLRDNQPHIDSILKLRQELAEMLDFSSYAELALKKRLVKETDDVFDFLHQLKDKTLTFAEQEKAELEALFKADTSYRKERETEGSDSLQSYDLMYYSERLRKKKYDFDVEEVKKYFNYEKVLDGLFDIVERLFGYRFVLNEEVKGWMDEVRFYDLYKVEGNSKSKVLAGHLYIDLFAREGKRGGAWMDVHQGRKAVRGITDFNQAKSNYSIFPTTGVDVSSKKNNTGSLQLPVAYLVTNFSPRDTDGCSLLGHRDIETVFHEMGHVLHHLLTEVDYLPVSGIEGVVWDGVELPSQFLENWCWDYDSLKLLSSHRETGEVLPKDLFDKMLQAKNFNAGLTMLSQVEYGLIDMSIHTNYLSHKQAKKSVQDVIDEIRREVRVIATTEYDRFQNSFSHIFDGGYAAGYYSYKWAEVMSADAFSLFLEKDIYDSGLGQKFKSTILAQGGSKDFLDLFVEFRGAEPSVLPLLEQNGLTKVEIR